MCSPETECDVVKIMAALIRNRGDSKTCMGPGDVAGFRALSRGEDLSDSRNLFVPRREVPYRRSECAREFGARNTRCFPGVVTARTACVNMCAVSAQVRRQACIGARKRGRSHQGCGLRTHVAFRDLSRRQHRRASRLPIPHRSGIRLHSRQIRACRRLRTTTTTAPETYSGARDRISDSLWTLGGERSSTRRSRPSGPPGWRWWRPLMPRRRVKSRF